MTDNTTTMTDNTGSLRVHAHNLFHRRSKAELKEQRAQLQMAEEELQTMLEKGETTRDVMESILKGERKAEYDAILQILTKRLEDRARRTGETIKNIDWGDVAIKCLYNFVKYGCKTIELGLKIAFS